MSEQFSLTRAVVRAAQSAPAAHFLRCSQREVDGHVVVGAGRHLMAELSYPPRCDPPTPCT